MQRFSVEPYKILRKMKKHLRHSALLFSILGIFSACSTSSVSKTQHKADTVNSKETTADCFVKMNDGSIREFRTLKLVTSPLHTPYLLADGKTKIKASQIKAYQNKDHYAVSQKTFCCGRISHVATETLPGFAVRTVKGRLNVYCKKYYNGQVAVDEFYLQVGDEGQIQAYSPELMSKLVKDNSEALTFFTNKKFKGRLPEKLHATAQLYNGGAFITKN